MNGRSFPWVEAQVLVVVTLRYWWKRRVLNVGQTDESPWAREEAPSSPSVP